MKTKTLVILGLIVMLSILSSEVNITPITHFAQAQNYGGKAFIISESLMICKSPTGIDIYEIQENNDLRYISHIDVLFPKTFRVSDNYVYVMSKRDDLEDHVKRFTQIDISDINEPVIVQEIDFDYHDTDNFFEIFNSNRLFIYETDSDYINRTKIYNIPDLLLLHTYEPEYSSLSYLDNTLGYDFYHDVTGEEEVHNLHIYDVSDINNIILSQEIEMYLYHGLEDMPDQLVQFGDSMLAAVGNSCITFWDISIMDDWQLVSQYSDVTIDSPIGIYEDRLITYENGLLKLYNIEDLNNIVYIDDIQTVQSYYWFPWYYSFFTMRDNTFFLSTFRDGIHKYVISENDISFEETFIEYPHFRQIFIESNYVFAVSPDYGLYIFDVGDIDNPILIPHNIPQNSIYRILVEDNKLGVSGTDGNNFYFDLYDFSDPYNLILISHSDLGYNEAVVKTYNDWDEVYIVNLDLYNQYLRKSTLNEDGSLNDIYIYDSPCSTYFCVFQDYAYYLSVEGNITNINVLGDINSDYPELTNSVEIGSYSIITMTQSNGILQLTPSIDGSAFFYDTIHPETPELITQLDQSAQNGGLYFQDHYFSPSFDNANIYDFTNPSNIVYPIDQANSHANIMQIMDMNINNQNYLAVCNQGSIELWSIDVANSADYVIEITETKLMNYPNPFNPTTTISFSIHEENVKEAEIQIYNIKGQMMDELMINNEALRIGEVVWNAVEFSSGVYFYRLVANGKSIDTKKMLLVK